ncbi:hypothetical protein SJAG_16456 [Schizosaccharomyces japonicus yFS275]|uniref:Methionyl/Leucyl tRNA synthetase domain-containing protein n=1 Tax=Schizosaccharomyces japonicus (strain yFS275 / FY16936) TaxID=402676 RepID=T0TB24_SCHJY|nr:hypothetical protein SJAG_16456 [Schizosaccharomyces japonicus yFS275]EQC53023.1 hypothetical protein SJAG_16456 [Schizosaccharomyces japonicus yFS275]
MNPNTFLRSTLKNNKPFFITTPIFYVNARPHVGHLYTLLLVDAIARYNKLKSNVSVISTTGTDEHGMKIQKAALAAGMKPLEFCSQNSQHFANLAVKANTDFTHFIRTTNKHHVYAVHNFWEAFSSKWMRLYITTFQVGKNYHFRLSHWTQTLLRHYHQHPDFVQPAVYHDAVVAELERGLKDLSISRPTSRIPWGILTPGDPTQTVYVWLDALVNYVSAIGYPWQFSINGTDQWMAGRCACHWERYWCGFHCIYWPAFLLAAGLKLPKHILVHGHWTMKDMKMSKSRGNVVDPFQLLERYGVDSVRYYLLKHGRLANDANFDENGIQSTLES